MVKANMLYSLKKNQELATTFGGVDSGYTLTRPVVLDGGAAGYPMAGASVSIKATVGNALMDKNGNCTAHVNVNIIDSVTNDKVADGKVTVRKVNESRAWLAVTAAFIPEGKNLNNLNHDQLAGTVNIASTQIVDVKTEINDWSELAGELTSFDLDTESAKSACHGAVGAVQGVILSESIVNNYNTSSIEWTGALAYSRNHDATKATYTGDSVWGGATLVDTDHNLDPTGVDATKTRAVSLTPKGSSNQDVWTGQSILGINTSGGSLTQSFILKDSSDTIAALMESTLYPSVVGNSKTTQGLVTDDAAIIDVVSKKVSNKQVKSTAGSLPLDTTFYPLQGPQ